jgi:electron transport complex protein RnfC
VGTERLFGFLKPRIEMDSWDGEVKTLPPPDRVKLPLACVGEMPFVPEVQVGAQVRSGQILAATRSRTAVHATLTGEVTSIGPLYTPDGREIQGIELLAAEKEIWVTPSPTEDLRQADADELIDGLVDLGFSSPWKPEDLRGHIEGDELLPVTSVAIVAIDREPGVAVQRRILTDFRSDFVESVAAIRIMAGDARVVVVVPQRFRGELSSELPNVELMGVSDDYIDNDWRLILARIVGVGNLTVRAAREAGLVLLTAEDVAAAGLCLKKGLPRTDKLVTVSGKGLAQPVTVSTRLGTPIGYILEQLGLEVGDGDRVLLGGLLRGHPQFDLQAPITRETDAVTVLGAPEVYHPVEEPCINCGRCGQICPVNIQVGLTARYAEFGLVEEAYDAGAHACIECGLCGFVCPAHRPLLQYMRSAISARADAEASVAESEAEVAQGAASEE